MTHEQHASLTETELRTIDAHNTIASTMDDLDPDLEVGPHLEAFEWYIRNNPAHTNRRLIDIGCGSGKSIHALKELGVTKYVGIDASPEMIRQARNRFPTDTFHVSDFYSLPTLFQQETFPYFFASGSLYHVPRTKMPDVLRALHSVIAMHGYGFVTFAIGRNTITVNSVHGQILPYPLIGYEWEPDVIRAVFGQCGFRVIEPYTCHDCGIITDIVQKM